MTRSTYGRSISTHVERSRPLTLGPKDIEESSDDKRWSLLQNARNVLEKKTLRITVENLVAETGLTRAIIKTFFKKWPGRRHTLKVVESKRGPKG